MSDDKLKDINWFKHRHGETEEKYYRRETLQETLNRRVLQQKSAHELRKLGIGEETIWISEEQRLGHAHVIGTTQQGKSRFLIHNIQRDIQMGNGVLFLDPTDRAETVYEILKYCCSIGFDKVLLIDPHHLFTHDKVPLINPFHKSRKTGKYSTKYRSASINNIRDVLKVLYGQEADATPRINDHLNSVLNVLWQAGVSLYDALYFTRYGNMLFNARRDHLLGGDEYSIDIRENFAHGRQQFENNLGSTSRRLREIYTDKLKYMFASYEGINFDKMVTEGWVILVNLYPGLGINELHSRFLGLMIISEILFSIDRLVQYTSDNQINRFWKPFYIYIDEAGRFINQQLVDTMSYKLKSGVGVTIAHQYMGQIKKIDWREAVQQLTKIKVMFHTPDYHTRMAIMRQFYGGEISPEDAAWANSDISKQHAIIKADKAPPRKVKIPDVPTPQVDHKVLKAFIEKLYQSPWYKSPAEIEQEINDRYTGTHNQSPPASKASNSQPASKASTKAVQNNRQSPKGHGKGGPISI
jgi:hypothetical protein